MGTTKKLLLLYSNGAIKVETRLLDPKQHDPFVEMEIEPCKIPITSEYPIEASIKRRCFYFQMASEQYYIYEEYP